MIDIMMDWNQYQQYKADSTEKNNQYDTLSMKLKQTVQLVKQMRKRQFYSFVNKKYSSNYNKVSSTAS